MLHKLFKLNSKKDTGFIYIVTDTDPYIFLNIFDVFVSHMYNDNEVFTYHFFTTKQNSCN